MTTEELSQDVTRQALIEYLAHRKCANALKYNLREVDPQLIAEGLLQYVNERYATHDQYFKDRKVQWLTPRIHAAWKIFFALDTFED